MKKNLVALAIASSVYATPSLAESLSNSTHVDEIEKLVVTASRSESQIFDALAAVEVVTRVEIEQLQPDSLADLLSRFAGITAYSQGTAGHQTSLFVRGTNSDHVLVLVNGVRVGSATLGSKQLSNIPVAMVERVEVVKGPRAALWGSDAIGGVIQIFTRQQEAGSGQLGAIFGHDSFQQFYASYGFGNQQHSYTLSASSEKSDGFDVITPDPNNLYAVDQPDDDGYKNDSVSLVGTSQLTDNFSLELNGQFDQGNTEIDASWGGDEKDHENYHVLVRGHLQLDEAKIQLGYAKSKDQNEDNADDLVAGAQKAFFETSRDQVNALVYVPLSNQTSITAGVEWYDEEVNSSTAFSDTSRDAYAAFATARQSLDLSDYKQLRLKQLHFEQALRYDEVGDTDSETTFQLSAGINVTDNWLVALSHGTGFKAPTFNDLYWPDAFGSRGNPDLVSETSANTELLTRYHYNDVALEVSAYQNNIDDLIEWAQVDPSDPYSVWQPSNVDEVEINGLDASLSFNIKGLQHQLFVSHIDAENKATNRQLARRPHISGHYQVSYQGEGFDLAAAANYLGSRTDGARTLASYTLINLTANYQVTEQLALQAKLTNVFDKEFYSAYQYQGDGRGFRLGVDYQF